MDIFDEVTKEVEKDRLKSLLLKYRKHLAAFLLVFVIVISGSFLYRNHQASLVAKSYQEYINNRKIAFTNDMTLGSNPNAVDVIHFISKYSYLASSGNQEIAKGLLNSTNYNQVDYQPFRELLYLYDNNRDGNANIKSSPVFKLESQFITALNYIKHNDLESAYVNFNELAENPEVPEFLKEKALEFKKIIQFNLNERKS